MSSRDNNFVKIHLRLSRHPAVVKGGFAVDLVFGLLLRLAREVSDDGTFSAECLDADYLRGAYRIDADIPNAVLQRGIEGVLGRPVTHVTTERDMRSTTRPLVRVDGDRAAILGWEDDYGKGPVAKTAAERKRDERERKKLAKASQAGAGDSERSDTTASVTRSHAASRDMRDGHACHDRREENRSDHYPLPPRDGRDATTGHEEEDEDTTTKAKEPTPSERPANVVTFKPAPVAPPSIYGSDPEIGDLVERWQSGQGHRRDSGLVPSPHVVSTLAALRDEHGHAAVAEAIATTLDTAEKPSLKYLRKVCASAAAGETQRPARAGSNDDGAPRSDFQTAAAAAHSFVVNGEWRNGVYMSREHHEAREANERRRQNPPTPEENAAVMAQLDALLAVLNAPVPAAGAR